MKLNRSAGFTLMEIMIVVAVIAVLALALLPNLLSSRQAVQDSSIEASLQRAMTAQEVFHARCGTYYAGSGTSSTRCPNAAATAEWNRIYQDTDPNVAVTNPSSNSATSYCIQASHTADSTRVLRITGSTTGQPVRGIGSCS